MTEKINVINENVDVRENANLPESADENAIENATENINPTENAVENISENVSENVSENTNPDGRKVILSARELVVTFSVRGRMLKAIRRCSLDVYEGETLAIVGESGSGKSVFCKTFIGMLEKNGEIASGSIKFEGEDLAKFKTEKEWLRIRGGKIAMVMQDPMTSLNPLITIGKQIRESVELHQGLRGNEAYEETIRIIEKVGLTNPTKRYGQYPHELSGGMRQRVVIAIACACRPKILICDEPTTALDVTIQRQILELIQNLKEELGMTVIFITHDLGVVASIAERVAVMYAGQLVEIGMAHELFFDAWHPYTWALLSALPQLGSRGGVLPTIDGTPPNLYEEIRGDAFAPRNKMALAIDYEQEPPWFQVTETHKAKTWYLDPRCPAFERPKYVTEFHDRLNAIYGEGK